MADLENEKMTIEKSVEEAERETSMLYTISARKKKELGEIINGIDAEILKQKKMNKKFKVMLGGAPVTKKWVDKQF